jgi:hypothetical protein
MPLRMERAPLLNHLTRCIYFLSLFFFPTDQFPLELMWLPPKGQCWMLLRERVLWLQAKRLPPKRSRFNPHLFKKNFINFSVVRLLAPLVLQAKQLPPKGQRTTRVTRSRFNSHLFKKTFINFSVVRLLAALVL